MSAWALAALCLCVPPLWSLAAGRVFAARDEKQRRFSRKGEPPSDYSI